MLTIVTASLGLAFFLLSADPGRASYSEPSTTPTTFDLPNPALQFLNGADYPQQKLGSLIVGSDTPNERQLCLNGTATYNPSGPLPRYGCISAWSDIIGTVAGKLQLSTLGAGQGGKLADYTVQPGYIHLKNQVAGQDTGVYSLITANASTPPAGAAALLAISNSTSSYAGYFSGRLWIGSLAGVAGQLCLNGTQTFNATTRTGNCISAWTDLIFRGGTGWWRLQSSPMTADSGRIALNSSFLTGTLVVGDAAAVGNQYTCGDGLCSSGEQSAGSCPLDCAAIPSPTAMTAVPGDRQAAVSFNGAAGNAYVLTRQTDTATVWQPMDGVAYAAPAVFGPATVVAVGNVPGGGVVQITDTGLTNGTAYTYYAFQANAFPRYSAQTSAVVTPAASTVLTVVRAGSPGTSAIRTTDGFIDCPSTCSRAYSAGASVTLVAAPATGYAFTGWSGGGCSGTGQCALTINASTTVTGTFQPKYTVSVTPPGAEGVVSNTAPSPANQINCGTACIREFPGTTTITLRATPAGGYFFAGWSGPVGCAGTGLCTFVLNGNVTVTATFSVSGGDACFSAQTLIDTPTGRRPISSLRVGDAVYSFDHINGRTVVGRVTQTFVHPDRAYGRVTLSDGAVLEVTANHPVYDARARSWRPIGTMKPGDVVLRGRGLEARRLTIRTMEFSSQFGPVYNLAVEPFQTYYANGVVVHNKSVEG